MRLRVHSRSREARGDSDVPCEAATYTLERQTQRNPMGTWMDADDEPRARAAFFFSQRDARRILVAPAHLPSVRTRYVHGCEFRLCIFRRVAKRDRFKRILESTCHTRLLSHPAHLDGMADSNDCRSTIKLPHHLYETRTVPVPPPAVAYTACDTALST